MLLIPKLVKDHTKRQRKQASGELTVDNTRQRTIDTLPSPCRLSRRPEKGSKQRSVVIRGNTLQKKAIVRRNSVLCIQTLPQSTLGPKHTATTESNLLHTLQPGLCATVSSVTASRPRSIMASPFFLFQTESSLNTCSRGSCVTCCTLRHWRLWPWHHWLFADWNLQPVCTAHMSCRFTCPQGPCLWAQAAPVLLVPASWHCCRCARCPSAAVAETCQQQHQAAAYHVVPSAAGRYCLPALLLLLPGVPEAQKFVPLHHHQQQQQHPQAV
jgi:hypothetical protein